MKPKAMWIFAVVLGATLLAGTAWSQGFGRDGERGPGWRGRHGGGMRMLDNPEMREQLGLTEEQAEQLRALRSDAAKSGIRTRAELTIKQMELRELLQAEEPDRARIEKKVRELSDARYTAQMQRIDQRLAFRSVLTPDQRKEMRNLRRQFRQRRGGRGFGSGPRRFGPRRHGSGPGRGMEPAPEPAEPPLD